MIALLLERALDGPGGAPGASQIPDAPHPAAMLIRLAWGLGKFAVKHVVVPIAITAVTAVVLERLAERVAPREEGAQPEPNGAAPKAPRAPRAAA